jgi:hypothetical protein
LPPPPSTGLKVTRILWEYVVGGFMRYKTDTISGAVDKVLGEQIAGLTKLLGPAVAEPVVAPVRPSQKESLTVEEPAAADASATEATRPSEAAPEATTYTPDATRDDAAAGESVKSALDQLFRKKDDRLPPGR